MQVARLPAAAGAGCVGGALVTALVRAALVPTAPSPFQPAASEALEPFHYGDCGSLSGLLGSTLGDRGLLLLGTAVSVIAGAALAIGCVCGVLCGVGCVCALGSVRAHRTLVGRPARVGAYFGERIN